MPMSIGFKHSEETKIKISNSLKGRKLSIQTRRKMSEAQRGENHPMYGKHHSKETKEKISHSIRGENHPNYGKSLSEETKKRIGESSKTRCGEKSAWFGRHHTEETKKKISLKTKGRKGPNLGKNLSYETREKLRIINTGKTLKEETKLKISKSLKGKYTGEKSSGYGRTGDKNPMFGKNHSDETKRKISESRKGKYIGEKSPFFGKHPSNEVRAKMSASKIGLYCGKNNPNWRGGSSFEPYCPKFNREFKIRVRTFFGNKCILCGKTKEENKKNMGVHHVNYEKMVCCNDIEPIFVCLCRSCHMKTNFNREYWEEFLTNKINMEYNGKSFYTKEEYIDIIKVNGNESNE